MARDIKDIQQQIINTLVINLSDIGVAIDPNTWSKTNLIRLFTFVWAVCAWALEKLFDTHKQEVSEDIARRKPHSLRWYAEKAKAFQYGHNLVPEQDYYDNTGFSTEQIELSRIVKYAAVVRQRRSNGRIFLRIKVATTVNDDLAPIVAQLNALREYFDRIADAGVDIEVHSLPPDNLKLRLKIYYNPLILSATGGRLDGTDNSPVPGAVLSYLQNLPFNGLYVVAHLVDGLQQVEGVEIPHVVECYATYGNLPFVSVDVEYLPDAGYLRIDPANLHIDYIPHSQIK